MDVIVREYVDDDYEAVDKILFEAFSCHKKRISDSKVFEFVACLENKVVGYFNILEEIDIIKDIKIFHIGYVCVDTSCRGAGIGHKMMEYALSYAEDNKAFRVELTSGNQREAAHRLYLSLGFEKRDSSIFRKEIL